MSCYLKLLIKSPTNMLVVRKFSKFTQPLYTVYDPKMFIEPTVDYDELQKPLEIDDERKFKHAKAMNFDQSPVFYRNHVVDKLVRVCMKDGKKDVVRKDVLEALEIMKRRQYKSWLKASDEEKKNIELNPFVIAEKGISNCKPMLRIQKIVKGGITYSVPRPITDSEAEFRAMKTMRDICRAKARHGESDLARMLASELFAAYNNDGLTIRAKQEFHKLCDANKAYVQYIK
uniref:Small ribosomal subunit protein uS7m n=1 Tax=Strongyloides stercoralis TaxID=6248 RepID=A0A0K0DX12_STRER